ncbi:metallophosphoesterase family protein [Heyndrickxia oleronia]|uniref:metallophosphoesterase family protein n=1 Tax=Heyndrickxia oleronia TaxID=38875 RepID=UPI001B012215|nr:DNA repair exonuclease [Heyndrickxia oleronia]GIN37987.1 DNA repair exonuclease [Heyndrickxia oleronia]
MSQLQFIHTADLHLDSPFIGLQYLPKTILNRIQESTFASFIKIVDNAISLKVDFVLIAGDLYDGEDRSIKAQARLRKQMIRLEQAGIEVFILHGNHDHLGGNWTTIDMPSNVHVFSSSVEMKSFITKKGQRVHIYGFSYPKRHVTEKRINEYKKIEPADFHIGMLHGNVDGGSSDHQPYAPFTIGELLEKKMDYWALGHIHKQQFLHQDHHPYIVYPGNIQGRNRKEKGSKGCIVVNLSSHETTLSHIETADILWSDISIDASKIRTFSDLYLLCRKEMNHQRSSSQGVLLEMTIKNIEMLEKEAIEKIKNGELLEALQDGEEYEESFVWTISVNCHVKDQLVIEPTFKKELEQTLAELTQEESFEKALEDLYGNPYSSRYLEKMTEHEKKNLLQEAEQLVFELVHSNS